MYLPFTRTSDVITKWILCFKKETINDVSNILICNNQGKVQLKGICENLSELSLPLLSNFRIDVFNTSADPLNIFKSNTNRYETIILTDKNKIGIDSEKDCQRDTTHRYMTMRIPVTKPVFMKVISMSICAKTKLSDLEILDIMEHFLIFLDNQMSVQRLICQYFLNDNSLYDRLKTLCEERTRQIEQKKSCFEVAYCNLVMEMRNEMCVYVEYEHYNVVFMSDIEEKKNRLLVHTNFLNIASYLFPKSIMEMNSGFLLNNRKQLYKLYREASLDESLLVIDIDFSDIFRDPVGKSYIEPFCSIARLKIHKVLKCKFLVLCCVKKIVL